MTQRYRILGVLFLFSVFILLGILSHFGLSKLWNEESTPLTKLEIEVAGKITQVSDIQSILADVPGVENVMQLDVSQIQQVIVNLPWIASASVRKQWPDTLKVYLEEYQSVAQWNETQWLDHKGHAFTIPQDRTKGILVPKLFGPEGSGLRVLTMFEMINRILKQHGMSVEYLTLSPRYAWTLNLNDGTEIKLGRQADASKLNRYFEAKQTIQQEQKEIAYIDLRYEAGLAVGWKPLPGEE